MEQMMAHINLRNGALSYSRYKTDNPNDNQHHSYVAKHYQLYYLIAGSVVYQVEGQGYRLNPGDLVILNNKEVHRPYFESDESYERILLFFNPELCRHYCSKEFDLLQLFERKKPGSFNRLPGELMDKEKIEGFFREMESHSASQLPQSSLLIELTFIRLLVYIHELAANHPHALDLKYDYHEKLEQIIMYINDNLDLALTLDGIEQTFHMNKYYFSHLFKKVTGVSFKQYVINKRLSKAADLLKLSISPTEAARLTGFEDYSNFYRAFKKMTGMSPSSYSQTSSNRQ